MRVNKLKASLQRGEYVVGPFINILSPAVVEIMGYAGFDFVILDMEHSSMDFECAENLARAADSVGLTSIVRVPENNESDILRALETGAQGVEVPHVDDGESARRAVVAAKYSPLGTRGVSPYTRAANYFSADVRTYFEEANRESMVVLHMEGTESIKNLDAILNVPNIDVLFLGPYDLSQSLGIPGRINDPRVIQKMTEVTNICRKRGVSVGTFVDTPEKARRWIEAGVQYISYSVDAGLLYEHCREIVNAISPTRKR